MSEKLEIVLTWVDRLASAAKIAVPAVREIVSVMDPKPEVIEISNDER
jgi:hypothetical protein